MNQGLLWQANKQSPHFAELCNALYERELRQLAALPVEQCHSLTAQLKSLPYYIQRTAFSMLHAQTPLMLDIQNASWSAKQAPQLPLSGQTIDTICAWYQTSSLPLGLVLPILHNGQIILDCIDRVEPQQTRLRCNAFGWFDWSLTNINTDYQLLKPTKRVMIAACAGHNWRAQQKVQPVPLALRSLLLSCQINWKNFNKTAAVIN